MYPIWEVPSLTSGLLLGLMAAFHILPSHLSTGAMWFNLYIEHRAIREERSDLQEFLRKYSLLLLVFAYVFGSLSGVGIWYLGMVANPRGLSGLIHAYVWGWATEWVFSLIEVVGIFVYAYTLGRVDRSTHLKIGWIFALASWTTMVLIVGILAFMVSPGRWPQTAGFFDGLFNETYWPQLAVRTCGMFAVAALYALVVAAVLKEPGARKTVARAASVMGLSGLGGAALGLLWYRASLPPHAREVLGALAVPRLRTVLAASAGLTAAWFVLAWLRPARLRVVSGVAALVILFAGIWSAERLRELARKPFVLPGYLLSNQIRAGAQPALGVASELPALNERGILASAPFVPEALRRVTEVHRTEAGRMVALMECSACHALKERGLRPLPRMVQRLGLRDPETADLWLQGGLDGYAYMLPFVGTSDERRALASYLATLAR